MLVWPGMHLRDDIVHACRLLRRAPVFTLTAVLSLTIGIGANAALFSLADALLLRDRAGIADPGSLVDIGRTTRGEGFDNMSYPNFADFRERTRATFAGVAGFRLSAEPMGLGVGDRAERVFGQAVSGNYFAVLGAPLALGRGFLESEDRIGAPERVVVVSHRMWQRRFAGDRGIIGRTIYVNGRPFTVVGVAGEGFAGNTISDADLWLPLAVYPATAGLAPDLLHNRRAVWMIAVGRLKPGVSIERAQEHAAQIARDLERSYPKENEGRAFALVPSHRLAGFMRTYVLAFVGLLFGLVGLVLAIVCTNVAGLLLARSVARAREVAVRIAVGAARARIVVQLVTESLLVSAIGAVGGVVLAFWMVRAFRSLLPALPILLSLDIRLDWRVVGFAVVLSALSGLVFGLVPALQAVRADLMTTMRSDSLMGGGRRLRLRQSFVVAQVAMSVLLVVVGLLLGRSLRNAGSIDPGFDAADVEVAALDFRLAGYTKETGGDPQQQILTRLQQLPSVRSASYAAVLQLAGGGLGLGPLTLPGKSPEAGDPIRPDWNVVTPEYFQTVRTAIVRGRGFTADDVANAPAVAVVNETFARRAWPGEDAIGKTLDHHGDTRRVLQVVGIARDGKYRSLGEDPRAFIYVPLAQNYYANLSLLVRTDGTRRAASDIREVVRQVNPQLPVISTAALEEMTALGLLPHRIAAAIAAAFGLVGLLLAGIGIYGITAYNVTQRTREIGLRVALGADRPDVLCLVIGQAMRMSGTGAAVGLLLATGATQLLVSLLYGVTPLDIVSFGGSAVLFCAIALAASWVPARRAASLNPVEALRSE